MGKSFTSEGTSNRPFTQSAKKKSKQIGKGTDLKSKEEEYRKMNEELEAKAASLLKEADTFLMRDTESLLFGSHTSSGLDQSTQKNTLLFDHTQPHISPKAHSQGQRRVASASGLKQITTGGMVADSRPNTTSTARDKGRPDRTATKGKTPKNKVAMPTDKSGMGVKTTDQFRMGTKTTNQSEMRSNLSTNDVGSFGRQEKVASEVQSGFVNSSLGTDSEVGLMSHPAFEGELLLGTLQDKVLSGQTSDVPPPRDARYYDDVLPEVAEGVGSEALIRILKAKVRVMQEEVDRLNSECKEKDKLLGASNSKMSELSTEQTRLKKAQQSLVLQMDKQKQLVEELRHKNDRLEAQLSSLKKELDGKERVHKQLISTQSTTDVRLNRALEEVEKYKVLLQQAKAETKEFGDQEKRKMEKLLNDNKKLEKQKSELITAFKKQQKMIDILKRQKMHLEAAKVLSFTEEEFVKALDWGSQ
jgi:hypothetical protein